MTCTMFSGKLVQDNAVGLKATTAQLMLNGLDMILFGSIPCVFDIIRRKENVYMDIISGQRLC